MRRAARVAATALAGGGAALALWAAPPASDKGAGHPPPDATHSAYLRRVGSGEHVSPADNPGGCEWRVGGGGVAAACRSARRAAATAGLALQVPRSRHKHCNLPPPYHHTSKGVRVYPDVLSPPEAAAVLSELAQIKSDFGLSLISPAAAAMYRYQMGFLPPGAAPPVNMLRATARPEAAGQRAPPWGYGDGCDEAALPPALRALAARLRALPGMRLGRLRDVTVNYRRARFFRCANRAPGLLPLFAAQLP